MGLSERRLRGYAGFVPGWIGPWEIAILVLVLLLVFGPKRLPQVGRSLGKGMREFKDSLTMRADEDDDEKKPAAPAPRRGEIG